MSDAALERLSRRFSRMHAKTARPSIAPEKLLRALLLQMSYTIRSERQLVAQIDDNLLFRWFVELEMAESVWSQTTFTKNRDHLLQMDTSSVSASANSRWPSTIRSGCGHYARRRAQSRMIDATDPQQPAETTGTLESGTCRAECG
jgi:hypothetical protein